MKDPAELKKTILQQLRSGVRIGITTHVEPDGDGFCAALALQIFLRSKGFDSLIIVDEGNLKRFSYMMDEANLSVFTTGMSYDLLFILDCNSLNRLGERKALVKDAAYTIIIDHHVLENEVIPAGFSYVDTDSVSVGAILFRAFQPELEALPQKPRIQIGDCLYTTILNDTNNFANANTNAETFLLSSQITRLGIDPSDLHRKYFLNHSPQEMRYVGETLSTIELHHNNRILFMHSSLEMMERNSLDADSIMSITRWVQGIRGVDVIAYLREEAQDYYKLSLRSPVLDVNKIASQYGGGGHKKASGAYVSGPLQDIRKDLLARLAKAIEDHGRG